MLHLASNEDVEVREAALWSLLEIAQDKIDGSSGKLVGEDEKL